MRAKIYANYGVLTHEKQPVYTMYPIDNELADELTVIIPNEYKPYKTVYGNVVVTISGNKYFLCQALSCFPWFMKKLTIKQSITEDESNE